MARSYSPKLDKSTSRQPTYNYVDYTDVAHFRALGQSMNCFRENDELCDVTLLVEGQKIRAHKIILAAASPYFKAMFTGGLSECNKTCISIHQMDGKSLQQIIQFFYTAKVDITQKNVQELLSTASLLQVQNVLDACCEFMRRQLTDENCLGIASFADQHACTQLLRDAETFARKHFVDVLQNEEFMSLTPRQLSRLIADDELNVLCEERVFEAVLAWIKHDPTNRCEYASEVLKEVRFSLLSIEFLLERVGIEDVIRCDKVCVGYLLNGLRTGFLNKDQNTRQRRPTSDHQVLYSVGGMSRREASKSGEKYDPKEGKWTPICSMSICRWGASMGSVGPYLYICGGSDDTSRLDTVERYDPYNDVWVHSEPMSSSRNGVGVCGGDGRVYAIGGFDGSMPLNTAEYYDTRGRYAKWIKISPMNQSRFGVGCCIMDSNVYAVGGSDGTNLRTVERYDPDTNTWKLLAPMVTARKQVGVTALGGYIYAIGGCDHTTRYSSVERYDPSKDEWIEVCSMSVPRSGCGVAVLDGFIYAIGGYDGTSYLSSVERYDPLSNKWYNSASISQPRDCVAVCVGSLPPKKGYPKRT